MKKYLLYTLMILTTFVYTACDKKNNDPDNPKNPSTNETQNEFGDSRLIIGAWDYNGKFSYGMTFRSDGTAHWAHWNQDGYWSYDSETKTLATTFDGCTWNMTIINSEAMAGVSTGGNSYGFSRYQYIDNNNKLIIGTWKTKKGCKITFTENDFSRDSTQNGKYSFNPEIREYDAMESEIILNGDTYILTDLSGGYLRFYKSYDFYSQVYDYGEFGGEYYYISE